MRGFLIGIVSAWALFVALAIVVDPVQADIDRPTQEQLEAVWSVKSGEMHVAFRTNGIQAFYAVTNMLGALKERNPAIFRAARKKIAVELGVIAQGNDVYTNAIGDRQWFKNIRRSLNNAPISDEDKAATLAFIASQNEVDVVDVVEVVEEP